MVITLIGRWICLKPRCSSRNHFPVTLIGLCHIETSYIWFPICLCHLDQVSLHCPLLKNCLVFIKRVCKIDFCPLNYYASPLVSLSIRDSNSAFLLFSSVSDSIIVYNKYCPRGTKTHPLLFLRRCHAHSFNYPYALEF